MREAVVPALSKPGFSVRIATNADEAVMLLDSEHDIDVIFSDIVMPDRLSGIDLPQRAQKRHPDLRVIWATGYSDQHVEQPGVRLFAKPYEITEVMHLIQAAIHNASGDIR